MPAVKIGASRQVVIPKRMYDELGLDPGDYLEVELHDGKLTLTPKTLVDKQSTRRDRAAD
jgi:AbrB family looped-hinge helix DNA binding protein